MRHAPPVSVLCLGRGWRQGQAAIHGLAAAAVAAWAAQHLGGASGGVGVPFGAALAASILGHGLSLRLLRAPALALRWDGEHWSADDEPQRLGLMLHLGPFVLLRLRGVSGTRWLAVGRAEAGAAWHGLLVALHASRAEARPSAEGQGG